MRHRTGLIAALFTTLAMSTTPSLAVVTVTNFGSPDTAALLLYPIGQLAVSFTTGPAPAVLNTIAFPSTNSDPAGTTFSGHLWSDAGGHPGVILESYPGHFSSAPQPTLTLTSAGLQLAPNTTYWFEPLTTIPNFAYWTSTALTTEASSYGWTIGDLTRSTLAPWGPYSTGPHPPIGLLQVDATLLPEPTPLLPAAACGLAAYPLLRPSGRRRRTQP